MLLLFCNLKKLFTERKHKQKRIKVNFFQLAQEEEKSEPVVQEDTRLKKTKHCEEIR